MPYIGKKPADIIATAVDTTTGTFSGAVSASSVDADGGVTVDNITIDGTEIDLSSGDLTLDVAGDLIIDTDGAEVKLKDGGTLYGKLQNSSSDFLIESSVQDKDILLKGNDGGSVITALSLDMSVGGMATIANGLVLSDGNVVFAAGHGIDFSNASNSATGSTSALLDDYEEGEWTPQYEPASGAFGGSYLTQKGRYTKVGRKVTLEFQLVANFSNNTQSGAVKVIGLPFTVSAHSSSGSFHGLTIAQATRFTGDPPRGGQIQENSTKIFLWKTVEATGAGTDVAQLTTSNFILTGGNPNNLVASITYFAS